MTGILIVLAVVLCIGVGTWLWTDRAAMSNRMLFWGGALSSGLAGMDFTALSAYIGTDWRILAAMAVLMFAISVARNIPERA